MNYRKLLASLLSMLCLTAAAQQLGTWQMYLSYYIATKNVTAGSTVYSLMNGNLLSYDTEDGEVRTYDHLHTLSDIGISHIAYSKEADKLIIVYGSSNIDLLDRDGNVHNLSALKDKRILDKEISYVSIAGSIAYLVTGFGFVEVDMKEGVFRNTYKLGFNIYSVTASDEAVFLGTEKGIFYCMKSDNMQEESNWKLRFDWGGMRNMYFYQGKLMSMNNSALFILNPYAKDYATYMDGSFTFLRESNGRLIWGNATQLCYTTDITADPTVLPVEGTWTDVSYQNGTFWMSEQEKGLRSYKLSEGTVVPTGEVIQPSSPIRDLGYRVSWVDDRLLVAGGINTVGAFYNPATAMYYENGQWTNFTEMERPEEYPRLNVYNTTDLVQDPLDDTHHFASPFRTGLCEYRGGKFVKLYNHDNSPLKSVLYPSRYYYNYVTCSALSYDVDGNLWMANTLRDTVIHVLKPDGKWLSLYYPELDGVSLIDQILHHSSGIKLFSSRRIDMRGVFCLDTKGTDRTTDDRTILHQTFVNQDGTAYDPLEFYCLCEDLDGLVWVGTSAGLFVIEDVTKVFDPNMPFTQIKINRNDGSGLADYLLNDVSISCITIDAANRKWIGTHTNGAYLISADGQEMLHHFTAEDSPLLSDNVQSIAVHPVTGEVVFGTDKGLCSYIGDATAPEEELSKSDVVVFPNPVTPDYNGPIAIRGLTSDSEVKILSSGGQLVWHGTSAGGTCTWNGCADNGRKVASGVYHVVANTSDGGKAIVTRIVIAH